MTIQTRTENRKTLVKAVSEFTGQEQTYMGPPTFAYKVGVLTIDRNGVITSESEEGCEELKSFLAEHGFVEAEKTNLEISVPIDGMDGNALRNLVFMLKSKQYLLNRVVGGTNFSVSDGFVKALTDTPPESREDFISLFEANGGSKANKGIAFDSEKVTFTFILSDNADKNRAYAEVAAFMVARAKESQRVSPSEQKPENEKYYLRVWLMRLGFGGEGGKKSRKALLQGLKGHTAFRTTADEEKYKARYSKK